MADPVTSRKLMILEHLFKTGQVTPEVYETSKNKILYGIGDLADKIESSGGYREKIGGSIKPVESLSEVVDAIKNKNGMVKNIRNEISVANELTPSVTGVGTKNLELAKDIAKNSKGFSKLLPMLGMGAAALGALGIANKVHAGELGEAAVDTADLATDFVPVVREAKLVARPSELGNSDLPPEEMQKREEYNALIRKNKEGDKVQYPASSLPIIEPEDRTKYEDMKKAFSKITQKLNK